MAEQDRNAQIGEISNRVARRGAQNFIANYNVSDATRLAASNDALLHGATYAEADAAYAAATNPAPTGLTAAGNTLGAFIGGGIAAYTGSGERFAGGFTGKTAENNTGQQIGATVGGILGSVVPGYGTAVGAFIGSNLGSLADAVFGGDGEKRFTAGFTTGGDRGDYNYGEGDRSAQGSSGLMFHTANKRAPDDLAGAVMNEAINVDDFLTRVATEHGYDIDFSDVSLSGRGEAGHRDEDGPLFGLAGMNGVDPNRMADELSFFTSSWMRAANINRGDIPVFDMMQDIGAGFWNSDSVLWDGEPMDEDRMNALMNITSDEASDMTLRYHRERAGVSQDPDLTPGQRWGLLGTGITETTIETERALATASILGYPGSHGVSMEDVEMFSMTAPANPTGVSEFYASLEAIGNVGIDAPEDVRFAAIEEARGIARATAIESGAAEGYSERQLEPRESRIISSDYASHFDGLSVADASFGGVPGKKAVGFDEDMILKLGGIPGSSRRQRSRAKIAVGAPGKFTMQIS